MTVELYIRVNAIIPDGTNIEPLNIDFKPQDVIIQDDNGKIDAKIVEYETITVVEVDY